MCLFVYKSTAVKPVPVKKAFKMLRIRGSGYPRITTPYQGNLVPFGDGHYVAQDYRKQTCELAYGSEIYGGFLHSSSRHTPWADVRSKGLFPKTERYHFWCDISFPAFALDVCAIGMEKDMVSRGLYIPAMDLRNYSEEGVKRLRAWYPGSFTQYTFDILKKLGRPIPS